MKLLERSNINSKLEVSILFLTLLLQLTDVKLLGVKPIEGVGLFFLLKNVLRLTNVEKSLIILFSLLFVITLMRNHIFQFPEVQYNHILKKPYLISLVRYIEYLSCVGIMSIIRPQYLSKICIDVFFQKFLKCNVIVNVCILFFWIAEFLNFELLDVAYYCGGRFRLKGFFIEGGPLGLYNAILFLLCFKYCQSKERYLFSSIFLLIVGLSLSKAGAVVLIIVGSLYLLRTIRICKDHWMFKVGILGAILVFLRFGFYLFSFYTESLFDYEGLISLASTNPNHFWINGGRVPGYYIIQEMISRYSVVGIGMGNYQILRNSLEFLNGFPITKLWDYHGFGGAVDIIVEFGLVGLVLFFGLLVYGLKRTKQNFLIILGCLPFFFGLPLYFHYPWILFSIGLNINK